MAHKNQTYAMHKIWLISFSFFLLLLPFSSYIGVLPFIKKEWGESNVLAGFGFSTWLLGQAISAIFLVPLTDRKPPQAIILISATLLSTTNILFPLISYNYWTGGILRFLSGLGHLGVYVPGVRLISHLFSDQKRGTSVGIWVSAGYAGSTISLLFISLLLKHIPWREAYLVTALPSIAALFLLFFLLYRQEILSLSFAPKSSRGLTFGAFKNRAAVILDIAYALHTAELYIARVWLPSLLASAIILRSGQAEHAYVRATLLASLMFAVGILGPFVGGLASDRYGRTLSALVIFILSGSCSFCLGWILDSWGLLVVTGFFYGLLTSADSPIYSTGIVELANPDRIGATQSVQSLIGFSVGIFAPVIGGWLIDTTASLSHWKIVFGFNGLLAIIGIVALSILRRMPESKKMAAGKR